MNWFSKEAQREQKVAWDMQKFRRGVLLGYFLGLPVALVSGMFQSQGPDAALQELEHRAQQKQVEQTQEQPVEGEPQFATYDQLRNVEDPIVNPEPEPEPQPEPQPEAEASPDYANIYMERITKREGFRNDAYDDGTGVITVGIGHAMDDGEGGHVRRSQHAFDTVFGDEVNWDDIRYNRDTLTDDEVAALAQYDIADKAELARESIANFDELMPGQQEAIVDAYFRGDMGPKTIALIEAERFDEAAVEYLNHRQYQNAEALGISGIIPRMEHNAAGIRGDHD